MIDFRFEKALRTKMAVKVDDYIAEARQFMQSHKYLLRDLTNAQLYGLLNIVRNISEPGELSEHAKHQAEKAAKAGKKIEAFWLNWDKKMKALQEDGREIARSVNPAWVNDNDRMNSIAQTLCIKYVQHLIAEKLSLERKY